MLHFFASDLFCSMRTFFIRSEYFSFAPNIGCLLQTFCVRFERFSFASNIFIKFQIFKVLHLFTANIFYSLWSSFIRCKYFSFVTIILCSPKTLFYSIRTFIARFEQKVFVTYIKVFFFFSCIWVYFLVLWSFEKQKKWQFSPKLVSMIKMIWNCIFGHKMCIFKGKYPFTARSQHF